MKIEDMPTSNDDSWTVNDWKQCFAATASGYTSGVETYDCSTIPATPTTPLTPDDIARFDLICFLEGQYEGDVTAVVELVDGRWAGLTAWYDSSGWGCRDGVDWRITATRDDAIRFGLNDYSRSKLGLEQPS